MTFEAFEVARNVGTVDFDHNAVDFDRLLG
jgi:hypothetical protein